MTVLMPLSHVKWYRYVNPHNYSTGPRGTRQYDKDDHDKPDIKKMQAPIKLAPGYRVLRSRIRLADPTWTTIPVFLPNAQE